MDSDQIPAMFAMITVHVRIIHFQTFNMTYNVIFYNFIELYFAILNMIVKWQLLYIF